MSVSRKWTQAMEYAKQAAQLSLAGAYEDAQRILAAFRGYQTQFEENSIEWWLCTEAFEDEWDYQLNKPHGKVLVAIDERLAYYGLS